MLLGPSCWQNLQWSRVTIATCMECCSGQGQVLAINELTQELHIQFIASSIPDKWFGFTDALKFWNQASRRAQTPAAKPPPPPPKPSLSPLPSARPAPPPRPLQSSGGLKACDVNHENWECSISSASVFFHVGTCEFAGLRAASKIQFP